MDEPEEAIDARSDDGSDSDPDWLAKENPAGQGESVQRDSQKSGEFAKNAPAESDSAMDKEQERDNEPEEELEEDEYGEESEEELEEY